jgi:hypothetical protein
MRVFVGKNLQNRFAADVRHLLERIQLLMCPEMLPVVGGWERLLLGRGPASGFVFVP